MKRALVGAMMLTVVCSAAVSLRAHHSFAAHYDTSKPITIQGSIVEVRLTNPHSWFYLDVKDATGRVVRWSVEAGTPSGMIRNGYKRAELPSGTVVTITGFPSRQSPNVAMLRQLTTAAGKTYGMFGPQESPGAK